MENVIIVTINYRLHVLGFMSLPSVGISGNAGLKDQQMALEWVHENISNFNGDSDNICLFGESAGAACAHLHVLNSKSRKFFKSAICQSGTAFAGNSIRGNPEKDIRQLAILLGCKSDSLIDVYETLLHAPLKELYDQCEKNPTTTERNFRFRRWRIIIEEESDDAFVTKSAVESVVKQRGQINIPLLMGTNDGDGMPKVAGVLKTLKELNRDMVRMIPKYFQVPSHKKQELAYAIKRFYFGNRDVCEETLPKLVTLFTDFFYLTPQTIGNQFFARYQPGCKQFLYEFQFDGKLNIQKKLVKLEQMKGACHADDVFYLFGGELVDKVHIEENSREWKMRKTLCKLWTNFAKFHDPTPNHDNPLPFKWNPVQPLVKDYSLMNLDYLVLNDNMKMVENLNDERLNFWRNAYKKWSNEIFIKAKL